MAKIYTKVSRDPVLIPDDKGKKLFALKSNFENKKCDDLWIETDYWAGSLSQIKSIEFEQERRYPEITHEEADQRSINKMHEIRNNLKRMGIIKN